MADSRVLGTGAKFPLQVDPATGRIMTVSGNRSVKESIYLILMTQLTERIVRPDFGSDIMNYAFMDTTTTMMSILRRDLTQTIMQHEPRISDVSIDTEFRSDIGAVIININYLVSTINLCVSSKATFNFKSERKLRYFLAIFFVVFPSFGARSYYAHITF